MFLVTFDIFTLIYPAFFLLISARKTDSAPPDVLGLGVAITLKLSSYTT